MSPRRSRGLTISGGSTRPASGGGLCELRHGDAHRLHLQRQLGSSDSGGGIYNAGGTIHLSGCTVSQNSAGYVGGGLDNSASGTAYLTNCAIAANTSSAFAGGLVNDGTASLTDCTVTGNTAPTTAAVCTTAETDGDARRLHDQRQLRGQRGGI